MLESIKLSLRLTGNEFDQQIKEHIKACRADLKIAGVGKIKASDPLFLQAATLYAKAHFGFANMGEDFLRAYEALKVSMCLSGDYNA